MEELVQRSFEEVPDIINANEYHMACLFLVDTSGSMTGEPIDQLTAGLNRFKTEVCEDKHTRDILDVAIVEFNSSVNVIQDWVPVEYMEPVSLTANGGTDMLGGLRTAIDMILERGRFYYQHGTVPYCPWIIMITDGYPTGPIETITEEIKSLDMQDRLRLWSLAVNGANEELLYKLCGKKRALVLDGTDFYGFFDWANKSMRAISVSSPGERARGQELPDNVRVISDDWM